MEILFNADINPATGVDLVTGLIIGGAALAVLIVMGIISKKKKKDK